jgi:hypothetical protein
MRYARRHFPHGAETGNVCQFLLVVFGRFLCELTLCDIVQDDQKGFNFPVFIRDGCGLKFHLKNTAILTHKLYIRTTMPTFLEDREITFAEML